MIKPIKILSDVITTTAHTVNIISIVDNGDGTYTLTVDNTYYLHAKAKITINSVLYTIDSFVLNKTLVLSGASVPAVDSFVLDAPLVVHGTPQKVNGELKNKATQEYPIIWILEFLKASYDDKFTSAINTTLDLNIFFLTDINYTDFDIAQHQTNAIDPMANEIDFIIKVIKKRRDLFGEIEAHDVTGHTNFGEYITNKGYDKQILTDQVSGCQLELSLPYVVDVCENSSVVVSICNPVTITENNIFKEYVASGGTFNYNTSACLDGLAENSDSSYQLNVPSGGTVPLPDIDLTVNSSAYSTVPSVINQNITVHDLNGNEVGSLIGGVWVVPFGGFVPSAGFFEPLSWTGARVVDYDFDIPSTTPTNYNIVNRASTGGSSFNMGIYSNETFSSNSDFYLIGDEITATVGHQFFIGISLTSKTGDHYADIDYSFFVNSLNVSWFEGAVNGGVIATLTGGVKWSYRFEHISSTNEIKLYINNVLVKTVTTPYSSDSLNIRLLGRNANHLLSKHLAVVKTLVPNQFLGTLGDSITYGRAISGLPESNYIERTLSDLGNTYFTNPSLANAGDTTADVISMQLPLVASTYDAGRTKNVCLLMIGINDLRASVLLATIQANISTIVGSLQATGFQVVIQTVLPDFNTAWADRTPLNTWIVANSIGAEYVIDLRTTLLETDNTLYEVDKLHPLPTGMQVIADNLAPIIDSI